ncbi:MAG: hemolysin III family protein [Rikenellaceae bacterium]
MKKEKKIYIPTIGEEVANTISHGVMTLLILLFIPFASVWAYLNGGVLDSVTVSIYLISIFSMTLFSTLYHSMSPNSQHKAVFHILDHIFIYVAIAGTYTPIALCVIGGWQGIVITVLQWLMVIFGIFYKSLSRRSIPAVSLTIYLVMGWTIVLFMPLFIRNASVVLLSLVGAGGVFYSIGAWFYARKGFKYHHFVWHIFINLALAMHFIAIIFYLY